MTNISLMAHRLCLIRNFGIVSVLCAVQTWLLLMPGIERFLGGYVVLRTLVLSLSLMLWSVLLVTHVDDRSAQASPLIRRLLMFLLSVVVVVPIALRTTATLKVLDSPRTFLLRSIMNAKDFDGVRRYHVVSDDCDVDYEGFDAGSLGPIKHGLFRVSRNGRTIDEMVYRLSQRNGKLSSWWDSGTVMINGNYADDKATGVWDFYNRPGDRHLRVQFTESGIVKVMDGPVNGDGEGVVKGELNAEGLKNALQEMNIDWSYYK